MAAQAPSAPRKLFREEAQTGATNCLACGGPIELRGFGAVEQVSCPYCGTELTPEDSGELAIVQRAERARRQSALPLHARGTIDGHDFEIIGIMWRECRVDGVVYPWQEFLLHNPYVGYRYLMFTMTDGSWAIGEVLGGAPRLETGFGHRKVTFEKTKYKHFQTSVASVSYVEGEFPWQVRVGDQAVAHDFIEPPFCMSIEEASSEDGQDVNFTKMRHIEGAEVWSAFKLQGNPPKTSGVAMLQPNPYKKGRAVTWILLAVMLVAWLVAAITYVDGRSNTVVFNENGVRTLDPITEEVQIGSEGITTLEFEFRAGGLSNAWAYAEVMLISQESEEAIGFGATAEEWHGVSGGESWNEGNQSPTVTLGKVPAGKYLLQIKPSAGQQGAQANTPPAGLSLSYTLKQNVVLARYIVLPFFIILGFPIFFWLLGRIFEGRRWANSDYVTTSNG